MKAASVEGSIGLQLTQRLESCRGSRMELLCRNGNLKSWPSTQKKRVGAMVSAALLLMSKREANWLIT
jgi:hypothetical protein